LIYNLVQKIFILKKRVKLSVLGFSFNQTQSGTYGLVLGEENGLRRLMIIVGTPEAQSIAFKLHDTKPPRPLTHDLFQTLLSRFDIHLKEVVIYKYNDGVFFSRLIFVGEDNNIVTIGSRTSDAIAIALRTKSPIYTTETIMEELGVVISDTEYQTEELPTPSDDIDIIEEEEELPVTNENYSSFSENELSTLLNDAIIGEDYELASVLRDELDKRKDSTQNNF